jgi:hypothetical protein
MITVLSDRGAPTPVAWTRLRAPQSLMGAADAGAMERAVKASPLHGKYAEAVDGESAREILAKKLDAGAAKADEQEKQAPESSHTTSRQKKEKSVVEQVVTSTAFKQVARTAAREIVRGIFKTARR